jgi:hypothetical protein
MSLKKTKFIGTRTNASGYKCDVTFDHSVQRTEPVASRNGAHKPPRFYAPPLQTPSPPRCSSAHFRQHRRRAAPTSISPFVGE